MTVDASPDLAGLVFDLARDREAFDAAAATLADVDLHASHPRQLRAECALAAVALHAAYGAVESWLERVARRVDGSLPTGPKWHRDLLERMCHPFGDTRPAILSETSAHVLRQLLGFRHFFRHSYGVELDAIELNRHTTALLQSAGTVRGDLERFESLLLRLNS